MSPALKAWGNSTWRNFSSSATVIFAIAMSLPPALGPEVLLQELAEVIKRTITTLAGYYTRMRTRPSGYQVDISMTARPARATTPQPPILLREKLGSIGVLTLNRPEARNSLSEGLIAELHAALKEIHDDTRVRAAVIAASDGNAADGRADFSDSRAGDRPCQPCRCQGHRTRRCDCARRESRTQIRLHRQARQGSVLPSGRNEPCRRLSLCRRGDDREHDGARRRGRHRRLHREARAEVAGSVILIPG